MAGLNLIQQYSSDSDENDDKQIYEAENVYSSNKNK